MKNFFLILFSCLLLAGCQKKDAQQEQHAEILEKGAQMQAEQIKQIRLEEFLIGEWYLDEGRSEGAPGNQIRTSHYVPDPNKIITFKSNGDFIDSEIDNYYIRQKSWDIYNGDIRFTVNIRTYNEYTEKSDGFEIYYEYWHNPNIIDQNTIIVEPGPIKRIIIRKDMEIIRIIDSDNTQELEKYIKDGNDINKTFFRNLTPLMYAIVQRKFNTANLLINSGADLTIKSGDNLTAFQYALMYLKCEESPLINLINKGANVNEFFRNYKTAYDLTFIDNANDNTRRLQRLLAEHGGMTGRELRRQMDKDEILVRNFSEIGQTPGCLAFSPDGRRAVSGHFNGEIKLWDVSSGRLINSVSGHTQWVRSVSFSPDGNRIISGAYESVKMHDSRTLQTIRTLQCYAGHQDCLSYSRDGRYIASRLENNVVILNASGDVIKTLTGHTYFVDFAVFSPDGKYLISGESNRGKSEIWLWDFDTGNVIWKVSGHDRETETISFNSDSSLIASGGEDNSIRIWDINGQRINSFYNESWSDCVRFSHDGKYVISNSKDTIKIWDVSRREIIKEIMAHTDIIYCFALSPDNSLLITGARDGSIKLWDVSQFLNVNRNEKIQQNQWSDEK